MPPRRVCINKEALDALQLEHGKDVPAREIRCPDHNGVTCALCGGTGTVYLLIGGMGPSLHGGGADF